MEDLFRIPDGHRCATNQVPYSLNKRGIKRDLLSWCKEHDMPVMAYSPLGGDGNLLVGDHALARIGAIPDCSAAAVALGWVIRNSNVIAIPESGVPAHVKENAVALSLTLTPQELETLDAAYPGPSATLSLQTSQARAFQTIRRMSASVVASLVSQPCRNEVTAMPVRGGSRYSRLAAQIQKNRDGLIDALQIFGSKISNAVSELIFWHCCDFINHESRESIEAVAFVGNRTRNNGASVKSVVTTQIVMDSVASKRSSCRTAADRGLPA
jgi:Aldo/keto reductase family